MSDLTRRLYRSRSNKMIAGVAAGLAEYFNIDTTLARVLFVIASVVSIAFPGLILYGLMWVIIPQRPDSAPGTGF